MFLTAYDYMRLIVRSLRTRRNQIRDLEEKVQVLESSLETNCYGRKPILRESDDGHTYIYQCVGRVLTPHWTDPKE